MHRDLPPGITLVQADGFQEWLCDIEVYENPLYLNQIYRLKFGFSSAYPIGQSIASIYSIPSPARLTHEQKLQRSHFSFCPIAPYPYTRMSTRMVISVSTFWAQMAGLPFKMSCQSAFPYNPCYLVIQRQKDRRETPISCETTGNDRVMCPTSTTKMFEAGNMTKHAIHPRRSRCFGWLEILPSSSTQADNSKV